MPTAMRPTRVAAEGLPLYQKDLFSCTNKSRTSRRSSRALKQQSTFAGKASWLSSNINLVNTSMLSSLAPETGILINLQY